MTFGDPRLPDRFWEKVITEPNSGCWLWLAATDPKGYGFFWYQGKKQWAHRLTKSFQETAHHKCYVTCCVNPDHLIDVTREINSSFGHRPNIFASHLVIVPEGLTGEDVPF